MKISNPIIFIIGVSGSGKSTIGKKLSEVSGLVYVEADDYHPVENVAKMSSGIPLTDQDRRPWLKALNKEAIALERSNGGIISCSALKEEYRQQLSENLSNTPHWIFLNGSVDVIANRIQERNEHFMPSSLLLSQFEILEKPNYAFDIDIQESPIVIVDKILNHIGMKKEFGIIGMGVMGKSIARNMGRHQFNLSLYNRHVQGIEENVAERIIDQYDELNEASAFDQIEGFLISLERPRKILIMVKAGSAIDNLIEEMLPFLEKGDIIIDGGNSNFTDTIRRSDFLKKQGIQFVGCGVSGGEKGALLGPSIMPGCSESTYAEIKPYLEPIAAKDHTQLGNCCSRIGNDGAGHFVKMIHNGIEYAEMQLIAECIEFLHSGLGKSFEEITDIFQEWCNGDLGSYLLEITIDILQKKDSLGNYILDTILDKSGNKGTGSWSTITACELGQPATMISAALFARYTSSFYSERQSASELFSLESKTPEISDIEILRSAYQVSRIVNHHQGFQIIIQASETYNWDINLKELARIWTNGCIIRSKLMEQLSSAIPSNGNLLIDEGFSHIIHENYGHLQQVVSQSCLASIPAPCHSAAHQYVMAFSQKRSSAYVIQAQRDYFGAHTYQKLNDSSEAYYHTIWEE